MMKTVIVFFIAFLIGLFVQATLLHSLFPDIVVPDILLILVVFLGVRSRTPWGVFGAFLIGIGGDFASAKYLGPFAAGSVSAFLVTVFIANHLFSEKGFTIAFTAAAASIAKNLTAGIIISIFTGLSILKFSFLSTLLLEALLTGIVCPILMRALTWGEALTSYGPVVIRSSRGRV